MISKFRTDFLKTRSKRTYFEMIEFVALNDNDGGSDRLNVESIRDYLTVGVVAESWGLLTEYVARDIVAYRKGENLAEIKDGAK